jgi:hypothetical protein
MGWEKLDGELNSLASSSSPSVNKGPICYMGCGQYLIFNFTTGLTPPKVSIFEWTGSAPTVIKDVLNYGMSVIPLGIEYDGQFILVLKKIGSGVPTLDWIDPDTKKVVNTVTVSNLIEDGNIALPKRFDEDGEFVSDVSGYIYFIDRETVFGKNTDAIKMYSYPELKLVKSTLNVSSSSNQLYGLTHNGLFLAFGDTASGVKLFDCGERKVTKTGGSVVDFRGLAFNGRDYIVNYD